MADLLAGGAALADADVRAAVTAQLDTTMFLEAGAGSGKTAALVARIVALVDAGEPLDAIAAITFTEKAGAELRERLRAALGASPLDPVRRGRRAAALDAVDGAAIGTLHAFAQRVLREHPLEAGLPPAVEVMDEIESQLAFEERWRSFRERLFTDPDLERTVLLSFAAGVQVRHLEDVAAAFDDNWDLVDERVDRHAPDPPPVTTAPILAAARALCARQHACTADDDRFALALDGLRTACDTLETAIHSGDDVAVLEALLAVKGPGQNMGRRNQWPPGDLDGARAASAELTALVERLVNTVADACLRRLAAALAVFTLEGAEERRRHGRLEFHDLLVLARALLRGPHVRAVRATLHHRYRRILLDEFQDTDPIQIELAVRIVADPELDAADWTDLEPEAGSLFLVGDAKQSIYRFRRADIRVFLAARDALVPQPHHLDTNFRTVPAVLAWINEVFGQLVVATPRAQPAYRALQPHRPDPPAGAGPTVTVLGAVAHEDGPSADELRDREAAEVAAAVATVLGQGWAVADGSASTAGTGPWRAARPGDIAILLPARTSLPRLEEALERAGVPYRAESSSLVYATPEVRALLGALRAIDDPTDELAVVTALRSSLFGCSDRDLFAWRVPRQGSWHPLAPPPPAVDGDDRVGDAMAALRLLVEERAWLTPSQLLTRLVTQRRVLEVGAVNGRRREIWRRIRFVVDQARAWSEAGGTGLRPYLDWARRQAAEGARVAEVVLPETDDDAVRIMTVHAAKGLEFPIVVMSGLSTRPRSAARGATVLWTDDSFEVKATKDVTTERFDDALDVDEQLSYHERVRLLYVAATRAQDHLIVSLHRTRNCPEPEPRATSGELLAWAARAADQVTLGPRAGAASDLAMAPIAAGAVPFADFDAWATERARALATAGRRRTVAATALAAGPLPNDPGLAKDARDLDLPPWNKGRYGTAVGRAVHAVLQSVDLGTGEGLDAAAAAQAAAEGVLDRRDIIATLCRSALASPAVRAAARSPHWREVYVAVPVAGTLLEGYVDLLYRTADGLVVVDYKTDHVPTEEALAHRLAHYRRQAAAYAVAVEGVTQEPVVRAVFVFCRPERAQEREVADLRAAMAAVHADVASTTPPPTR
jgi:ATP-dependent helicase/nuclease subunit A